MGGELISKDRYRGTHPQYTQPDPLQSFMCRVSDLISYSRSFSKGYLSTLDVYTTDNFTIPIQGYECACAQRK